MTNNKARKWIQYILAVLIAFVILQVGFLAIDHYLIYGKNKQYGKAELEIPYYYSGILSGIFAGLSFIGVIATLIMQKKQTRIQETTLDIQRFETTFFNMLNLQQEITSGLAFKYTYYTPETDSGPSQRIEEIICGRKLFEHIFLTEWLHLHLNEEITEQYETEIKDSVYDLCQVGISNFNKERSLLIVNNNGMKFVLTVFGFKGYEQAFELPTFDHYFRHLYHIFKFIDNSTFLDKSEDDITERYKYASILRATLSPYELVWLFYNGLSRYGKDKFKHLIEKYSLLKNIRVDILAYSRECQNERERMGYKDDITGFPANDYEYFSTAERLNTKYYLSAFYNREDLPNAINERNQQESSPTS